MTFLVLFITFCTFLDIVHISKANWWPDSKNVFYSFLKNTKYIHEVNFYVINIDFLKWTMLKKI